MDCFGGAIKIKKEKDPFDKVKKCQIYKFKSTIFNVEPIFLKKGKRTLFYSLGKIVYDDFNKL